MRSALLLGQCCGQINPCRESVRAPPLIESTHETCDTERREQPEHAGLRVPEALGLRSPPAECSSTVQKKNKVVCLTSDRGPYEYCDRFCIYSLFGLLALNFLTHTCYTPFVGVSWRLTSRPSMYGLGNSIFGHFGTFCLRHF